MMWIWLVCVFDELIKLRVTSRFPHSSSLKTSTRSTFHKIGHTKQSVFSILFVLKFELQETRGYDEKRGVRHIKCTELYIYESLIYILMLQHCSCPVEPRELFCHVISNFGHVTPCSSSYILTWRAYNDIFTVNKSLFTERWYKKAEVEEFLMELFLKKETKTLFSQEKFSYF